MAILNSIPEPLQKGFEIILNLTEKEAKDLQSSFEKVTDTYRINDLIEEVLEMDRKFSKVEIDEIVTVARSISNIIEQTESSPEEVIEDIFNIIEKGKAKNIAYKNQNKKVFISTLKGLIQSESITNSSKAVSVLFANQNNFLSTRIITDIRPLFGSDLEVSPKGAVIVHSLKIHFDDSRCAEHKDIYIALDSKDIQLLKETILRAEKKERNLKSMLQNMDIKLLN